MNKSNSIKSNSIKSQFKKETQNFITKSEIFDRIFILSKDKTHLDKILKHTASDQERFIHNQAKLKLRFKDKFPMIIENKFTILPPRINCEQSSSFATSIYKTQIISTIFEGQIGLEFKNTSNSNNLLNINILDATCGFGIDSYAFATIAQKVIGLDINNELININNYNSKTLGITNLNFVNSDFKSFLTNLDTKDSQFKFDLIYLDPSRRDNSGNKVFKIEDLEPNIFENLELLKSCTKKALIKFSPLIDISYLIKSFDNLTEIFIVEYDTELKEILILLDFEKSNLEIKVNVKTTLMQILGLNIHLDKSLDLVNSKSKSFEFDRNINFIQSDLTYSEPLMYLYEPSVGEMKLGYWNYFIDLFKLSSNTNLFTTNNLDLKNNDSLGKFYKIKYSGVIDKKILENMEISKANIKVRNSSLTIDEAYKKLNIKSGGDIYIFLAKNLHNKNIMIICEKY